MLCHAIELALKAYLAHEGVSYRQLKNDFGHNLTELLTDAIRKGLSLTEATQMAIEMLNEAHSKFWHRYPTIEGGPWSFATIGQFEGAARELIQQVDQHLSSSSTKNTPDRTGLADHQHRSTEYGHCSRQRSKAFFAVLNSFARCVIIVAPQLPCSSGIRYLVAANNAAVQTHHSDKV